MSAQADPQHTPPRVPLPTHAIHPQQFDRLEHLPGDQRRAPASDTGPGSQVDHYHGSPSVAAVLTGEGKPRALASSVSRTKNPDHPIIAAINEHGNGAIRALPPELFRPGGPVVSDDPRTGRT